MDVKKYTDVDILAELSKLVDAHVRHYKEDFEYDRRTIIQAAKAELPEDRTLIWFCRECGTHCFRESQAFIRDTREHTTLRFYAEQSGEDITARVVIPKQLKGKKVMGDVFEVIFKDLAFKVAQDSIAPAMTRMTFADGFEQEVPFHKSLRQAELLVEEHGKITAIHVIPTDTEALADLLAQQKHRRERLPGAAKGEKLAPLPVADYRRYQAIKEAHPAALVCFAQNGYFELYGEDARRAAPLLGAKILDKKLRGHTPLPVTGFKEELWVAASKKLWKAGADVLLHKDGEVFKELKAADYIPIGAELDVAGVLSRIDKVDFAADRVFLTNMEQPERPIRYTEPVEVVRSYVEDAGLAVYESAARNETKETAKPRSSIRDKLSAAKKEQPPRNDVRKKAKERGMEL